MQEGAKRGVRIGVMRLWACGPAGSMAWMWAMVAFVSAMACEALASRYQSGFKPGRSMLQRPMKARWPAARAREASALVAGTWVVA